MNALVVDKIRRRVEHSISPETAAQAGDGMTVANIKQFIVKNYQLSEVQAVGLANYFQIDKG